MLKKTLTLIFLLLTTFLFTKKINLITADLGRHIKNGEIVLKHKNPKIFSKNYYSYTNTDFETINHHWGSGVIFYVIYSVFGFKGLSVFYILVSVTSVLIFMRGADLIKDFQKYQKSFFTFSNNVVFAAVLVLPLLTMRKEIRPEGLSYLFLAIFFYILMKFKNTKIPKNLNYLQVLKDKKYLLLLPLLQIIWINTHIFFIFGPFLITIFLIQELLDQTSLTKLSKKAKTLGVILTAVTLTLLINPNFIKGALVPLTIFKEYGYMLIENQSVFFMQKRFPQPLYIYVEILALIILQAIALLTFSKVGGTKKVRVKLKNSFYILAPLLTFMVMGFKSNRLLVLFGYFFIAFGAHFLSKLKVKVSLNYVLVAMLFVIPLTKKSFAKTGIGLIENNLKSAEFFRQNNIKGPIFNNYDIGGYLIYNLYPNEKVFVDNRPESYPQEFFKNVYVPMQEDETVWDEMLKKYDFNVIYFFRHDATPWAQPFLIKRLKDNKWVPVFVDDYVIILVRNSSENREVIDRFELPKGMFVVSQ